MTATTRRKIAAFVLAVVATASTVAVATAASDVTTDTANALPKS